MKSHIYVPIIKDKPIASDDLQGKLVCDFINQGWEYNGRINLRDAFGTWKEFASLSKELK
jgi:hypothetical protein